MSARALAATREATVVHVYNTAMIQSECIRIGRSERFLDALRAEFPEGRGQRSHA